ncbi:MAG: amidohydrolase [Deltaproteobacteria bacterium]|nr:amidohydrolase [Deltaproteobacteria bacterium]
MQLFDIIIKNATILTMNPDASILEDGFICVSGDTIVRMGEKPEAPPRGRHAIDAEGGIVLPGLINGHTHAAMTLFRGLADDLPLLEWLDRYIFPVERGMDGDFVRAGALLACAEMILSGTTTFCDMYLFEDEVAGAAKEAGMRCLVGEVLYDFDSPNYGPLEEGLRYTEWLIRKWRDDPLVSIAVEPHALFTCGPSLLTAAGDLAGRHHVPLIIHLAETESDNAQVRETYGKGPVDHLKSLGLLGPNLIADHCVHLSSGEIEDLAAAGVNAIHNPESNMKLASGIAPVPEMLAAGMTVGLGTDGCASNNNLDLFTEMDMAAKLQKVRLLDPTVMDAETVLKMATIECARALGMDAVTGSIEVGKKADIIIVDTRKPHLTPLYNPYSQLVYAARGNDVTHVLINGRPVMADRRLLTLDLEAVMGTAREKSREVIAGVKPR